jgi:hypothetical protein
MNADAMYLQTALKSSVRSSAAFSGTLLLQSSVFSGFKILYLQKSFHRFTISAGTTNFLNPR